MRIGDEVAVHVSGITYTVARTWNARDISLARCCMLMKVLAVGAILLFVV